MLDARVRSGYRLRNKTRPTALNPLSPFSASHHLITSSASIPSPFPYTLNTPSQYPHTTQTFNTLLLRRNTNLISPITHLHRDLVPAVVHVLQCLLVLAVLRLETHLRDRQPGNAENGEDADDSAGVHFDWRLRLDLVLEVGVVVGVGRG
jgi:hypothetical protein